MLRLGTPKKFPGLPLVFSRDLDQHSRQLAFGMYAEQGREENRLIDDWLQTLSEVMAPMRNRTDRDS